MKKITRVVNKVISMLLVVFLSLSVESAVIYNQVDKYANEPSLINIFTRKHKYWQDGSKIIVYIKPINSIEHKYFVMDWLGITPTRYKEMLESSVYSGSASNVNEVNSDLAMMAAISSTPNSIGYIDNKILLRGERNVKIIAR